MIKNQKVTLMLGEVKIYERWVTTQNDFEEKILREHLKTTVKNSLEERER